MKIYNRLMILVVIFSALVSCEDNEKSPLPAAEDASFVTIVFDNLILDVTDLENTAITGTLRAPVPNVASYDLEVRLTNDAGESSDFVPVYTATSFPDNFSIDIPTLASALGLDVSDFGAGNRFDFQATSTSTDGATTQWSTINGQLQSETGQLQSYRFTSFISCPFSVAEAIGTYELTSCGLGFCTDAGFTFEIVAGDNPNEVVMLNPYNSTDPVTGEPFEITIVMDLATGIGSIDEQPAFDTADTGNVGFFPTNIQADTGFFFSCTGTILFSVQNDLTRISDGGRFTFGTRTFAASKL